MPIAITKRKRYYFLWILDLLLKVEDNTSISFLKKTSSLCSCMYKVYLIENSRHSNHA